MEEIDMVGKQVGNLDMKGWQDGHGDRNWNGFGDSAIIVWIFVVSIELIEV